MQFFWPWSCVANNNILEAKYKHLVSSEVRTVFHDEPAQWKNRFYALTIFYIVTILCGVGAFLLNSNNSAINERTLSTDAIFGDSEWFSSNMLRDQDY